MKMETQKRKTENSVSDQTALTTALSCTLMINAVEEMDLATALLHHWLEAGHKETKQIRH